MIPADLKIHTKISPNPHLNTIKLEDYTKIISGLLSIVKTANGRKIDLLDIGGGKGWGKFLYERPDVNYYCLDLKSSRRESNITYLKGDITDRNLKFPTMFDVIFTKDTFEHILNPWDTTDNIIENLNEGGYFIFLAPFSWRYHASPYDAYRYTHTGAQYLFERNGKMKKVLSGYINFGNIKGFWKNRKDFTVDGVPFPRSLEVMYIGVKDSDYKFDLEHFDADNSWDHSD